MADYSISKDPTATNLTQSKNSTNRVTVTKNPGATKAYFTKSGGTEVAVVKNPVSSSELVISSPKFVTGEWTYNAGWVTNETTAAANFNTNTNLVHIVASPLTVGVFYTIKFDVLVTIGDVQLYCGATAGAVYSANQTGISVNLEYTATSEDSIWFDAIGFLGNIDNISLTAVP